jgi:monoamine oxidase
MQPAIADLVAELGLTAFAQNSGGDVVFERMSREPAHRYREVTQDAQSMRLAGGTSMLVRALARDLPDDRIRLGARVSAMVLAPEGIELTLARDAGPPEKIIARQVIAAVPPRLLEATVAFTPAQEVMTAQRWRDTPTWMAPHAKFFAIYERPFWREAGLSGTAQSMVGPMAEMHDATTASGRAALFGFLGIGADQRAALGEERLRSACLEQFARIFGDAARLPTATIFKDWAADALTATAADRIAAGYLAGAAIAARRAVEDVLAKLAQAAAADSADQSGLR